MSDDKDARQAIANYMARAVAARETAEARARDRRQKRRAADAARQRAKLGTQKRVSAYHPLGLTAREHQLHVLLAARPATMAEIGAALSIGKSAACSLMRGLTKKLAAQGHAVQKAYVAPVPPASFRRQRDV